MSRENWLKTRSSLWLIKLTIELVGWCRLSTWTWVISKGSNVQERMLHTIIKAATTTIQSKTSEGMTTCIHLNYASSPTLRSVRRRIDVEERITEWKDYTTRTSTRLSSATASQIRSNSANMVTTAHSHTQSKISKSAWSTTCCLQTRTLIFTSSTSKLNGARTITNIIKHNAYIHITSKTSDANLTSLDMILNFAKTGKVVHSSLATKKDANDLKSASSVTDGKNNSFIRLFIKPYHAKSRNVSKALNAPSTIQPKIEERCLKVQTQMTSLYQESVT